MNHEALADARKALSAVVMFPVGGRLTQNIVDLAEAAFRKVDAALRDSDGTAIAALCEDIAVPKDCPARAGTASPKRGSS